MKFVSIAVKKSLCSIMFIVDGEVVDKATIRYKDWDEEQDPYKRIIFAVSKAIRLIRGYIESNRSDDIVAFEVSNSTFVKWINQEYAKDTYHDEFSKMYSELNQIPMRYVFQYSRKPKASSLLLDDYISKDELSGVDAILEREKN